MPKLPTPVTSRIPVRRLCRHQRRRLVAHVRSWRVLVIKPKKLMPIEVAVRNASLMPEASRNQLRMADLSTLDALAKGRGTLHDVRMLTDSSNLTQILVCEYRLGGDEVKDAVARAEMAILQCAARFERTKRFGLTGPELQDLREMLDWADAQREVVTRSVYQQAVKRLEFKVRSGRNTIELDAAAQEINRRMQAERAGVAA